MYAIIKSGGKQYRVQKDSIITVEKIDQEEGASFDTDQVLFAKTGENEFKSGTPFIDGAKVSCKIVKHVKSDKVVIFKRKRRKTYRKKTGHRQKYTQIQVTDIQI